MNATSIPKSTFDFLSDLEKNNERPWFNDHKERYTSAHEQMIAFAEALMKELGQYDNLEPMTGKKSLHRIYRDTRFSKDKTPYKNHFSGGMKRATKWLRGGYYYHIEPGNTIIAGGFWGPSPADLKRVREEIAADDKPLRKIIADPVFIKTFAELHGDAVKTAPKGFSKDHPAIDLLRRKQFLVYRKFTDKQACSASFLQEAVQTFRNMRPFFDYMSEVLTTDGNGLPIE